MNDDSSKRHQNGSNECPSNVKEASSGHLVEHFFRHESANLIAVLSRAFGLSRIDLIEDMVQAAMLEAMNAWKQKGVPENPAGWIHRVARNRILDSLRREQVHQRAMAFSGQTAAATETLVDQWLEEERLPDSLLRMMFVCCHPLLDHSSQIALTLKILCGFSVNEIARGLLMPAATIKKRVQRAKAKLADARITFELPAESELQERLSSVHDTLYLMFNEGYSTSQGHDPIRDDLCEEAARLCHLLCEHPIGTQTTYALLSLMLFHGARLDSRVDDQGAAVLLEYQDRSQWDRDLIGVAKRWLRRSGEPTSRFHFESAIAMFHCNAESVQATDWRSIVGLYNRLIGEVDSPVYRLNRSIAKAQIGDVREAHAELESLRNDKAMTNYLLLDCARARVYELEGDTAAAIDCYLEAISGGAAGHQRSLIEKKLNQLRESEDNLAD